MCATKEQKVIVAAAEEWKFCRNPMAAGDKLEKISGNPHEYYKGVSAGYLVLQGS